MKTKLAVNDKLNDMLEKIRKQRLENPPEQKPRKEKAPEFKQKLDEEGAKKKMTLDEKRKEFERIGEPRATSAPDDYEVLHSFDKDLPYGWFQFIRIPDSSQPKGVRHVPDYTPSVEEEMARAKKKEGERSSLESGKAGKIILKEGVNDREIAQIKNMFMTILEQPGDTLPIKQEKQIAHSIMGGSASRVVDIDYGEKSTKNSTPWGSKAEEEEKKESSLNGARSLIARLLEAQEKPDFKALLDKLKNKTPKEKKEKQEKKSPEQKAQELAEMQEKGQAATEKGFSRLKSLEDFSPDELSLMQSDLLDRESEKDEARGIGWERTLPDGKKVYVLSNRQLGLLTYLYENAVMRHEGVDPSKARVKDSERKQKDYEAQKVKKDDFLKEIEQRKEEYKKQKEQEEAFGDEIELEDFSDIDKVSARNSNLIERIARFIDKVSAAPGQMVSTPQPQTQTAKVAKKRDPKKKTCCCGKTNCPCMKAGTACSATCKCMSKAKKDKKKKDAKEIITTIKQAKVLVKVSQLKWLEEGAKDVSNWAGDTQKNVNRFQQRFHEWLDRPHTMREIGKETWEALKSGSETLSPTHQAFKFFKKFQDSQS